VKPNSWADTSIKGASDKKVASDSHKEGKFSEAAEKAKEAFLLHREKNGDRIIPPSNLQKKMQSSGG
jgi:hypothetical protein